MKHTSTYISLARGNVSQKPFNRLLLTTFSKSSQVPSSYLFLPSLSRDPSKNQQHFPLVIVLDFYCTSIRFPCPQLSQEMCGPVIGGGGGHWVEGRVLGSVSASPWDGMRGHCCCTQFFLILLEELVSTRDVLKVCPSLVQSKGFTSLESLALKWIMLNYSLAWVVNPNKINTPHPP